MIEKDLDLSFSRLPRTKEHRRVERRIVLADLGANNVLVEHSKDGQTQVSTSTGSSLRHRQTSHVSYDVFLTSYWPHFPQSLVKGLGMPVIVPVKQRSEMVASVDPALVFNEFMGQFIQTHHFYVLITSLQV